MRDLSELSWAGISTSVIRSMGVLYNHDVINNSVVKICGDLFQTHVSGVQELDLGVSEVEALEGGKWYGGEP